MKKIVPKDPPKFRKFNSVIIKDHHMQSKLLELIEVTNLEFVGFSNPKVWDLERLLDGELLDLAKKLPEYSQWKLIEYLDIGGPTLIRAAAKNFNDVTVISDINDYFNLVKELKINNYY